MPPLLTEITPGKIQVTLKPGGSIVDVTLPPHVNITAYALVVKFLAEISLSKW
jgi:hypothetical protein